MFRREKSSYQKCFGTRPELFKWVPEMFWTIRNFSGFFNTRNISRKVIINSTVNNITLLGYNPFWWLFGKSPFGALSLKLWSIIWGGGGPFVAAQNVLDMGGHPRGFLPLLVAFGWKISKGFLVFSSGPLPHASHYK